MTTTPAGATLDHATINAHLAGRRFTTVEQLYDGWLKPEVPQEVAARLLSYAQQYDLDLSREGGEAGVDLYPSFRPDTKSWRILVLWSGIERICRNSGLWLPGRSELKETGAGDRLQFFIIGSCWTRFSTTSDTWVEVSEIARFSSHFQRDFTGNDLARAVPLGDWSTTPELKLSEVAQYLAAAKALGAIVTRHDSPLRYPAIQIHDDVIRQRAQERRDAEAHAPAARTAASASA